MLERRRLELEAAEFHARKLGRPGIGKDDGVGRQLGQQRRIGLLSVEREVPEPAQVRLRQRGGRQQPPAPARSAPTASALVLPAERCAADQAAVGAERAAQAHVRLAVARGPPSMVRYRRA
jgi:hypothetical protein